MIVVVVMLLVLNKQTVKYFAIGCFFSVSIRHKENVFIIIILLFFLFLLFFDFILVVNISRDYIPKQTFSTMMVELSILCLIIYAGYRFIMNKKHRSKNYKLLTTQDMSHTDYGTENVVF